jgi:N-acetylglucosaminyldiphosphoundecaprenol N-acetyl-beta-D-mannosaminyltransferase
VYGIFAMNLQLGEAFDFRDRGRIVTESAIDYDEFSREIHGIVGIPVDATSLMDVAFRIEAAALREAPYLISTPNLNFLATSQRDAAFRESLLLSDLSLPDGVPIVWIARLLGAPIRQRIPGSDIFGAAKGLPRRLTVFLFGGKAGVAEAAGRSLNSQSEGFLCAGSCNPGYGGIDEMSSDDIIGQINDSKADFLVVSLGAQKGQEWLLRNHHRISIPVRSHLGAAINFQAGSLKRAPGIVRKWGFEWLWRIKEEPYLWKRYWWDGLALIRILLTCVFPLAFINWWRAFSWRSKQDLVVTNKSQKEFATISLEGDAIAPQVNQVIPYFRSALSLNKKLYIDISQLRSADTRFFGLILLLRKQLKQRNQDLKFVGGSRGIVATFRRSGFGYLLEV